MEKIKNTSILRQETFTKTNIEPHQNFNGSYKKRREVLHELQDTQNIEREKGK